MPKRSRKYDRETAMSVKRGPESTSTDTSRSMPPAKKAKTDTKSKEKKTVEVKPAGETSQHMKNIIVAQLIREGKVRMTKSMDFSK